VTPNRGIDADFLDLPRHVLADAALSAARAAGASHADLRIHRLNTEIIQLRDGELETSVVSREVGLAVRVIVNGTWGFASHAELAPSVAAETARRALSGIKPQCRNGSFRRTSVTAQARALLSHQTSRPMRGTRSRSA